MLVHCTLLTIVIPLLANEWLQLSLTETAQLVTINAITSYQVFEVLMDELQTAKREYGVSTTLIRFSNEQSMMVR